MLNCTHRDITMVFYGLIAWHKKPISYYWLAAIHEFLVTDFNGSNLFQKHVFEIDLVDKKNFCKKTSRAINFKIWWDFFASAMI